MNSFLKKSFFLTLLLSSLHSLVTKRPKSTMKNDVPDVKIYCQDVNSFFGLVKNYNHEFFKVETADNYVLTVFRVNNGKIDSSKQPVLLIHGIVDSSDEWALTEDSVTQQLVRQNYDVWLMNTRGNKYSCTHSKFSSSLPRFWQFSLQELGVYDVPAVLKFINQKTDQKINIVGHSQGTSQVFVAFSELPDLTRYVRSFHAVAPVAYMNGFDKESIYNFMITHKFLEVIEKTGINRILERNFDKNWMTDKFLKVFCRTHGYICKWIISKLTDKDPSLIDPYMIRLMLKHNPSRTNIKSLKYFMQQIINYNGNFTQFDYGREENMKRYGQATPPIYNVSKVNVPLVMYFGNNDLLLNEKSVEKLHQEIKGSKKKFYPGWGHMSFFWGKQRQIFVKDLIEELKK